MLRPPLVFSFFLLAGSLGPGADAQTPGSGQPLSPQQGYVPRDKIPDSLAILPAVPAPHSATQGRDDAVGAAFADYRKGPRWSLAALDADLSFPSVAGTFSCALGVDINPASTPTLYSMLQRVRIDSGRSTGKAKDYYKRQRPFVVAGGPTCRPEDEADLRTNGSYPSGHSTVGWTWALVLAETDPDHASALLRRGRAFLQSRVVCNVHWLSDTEAGGTLAAAVVARLNDEPAFLADVKASEAEIQAARAAGQGPRRDCAAEAAAIATISDQLP